MMSSLNEPCSFANNARQMLESTACALQQSKDQTTGSKQQPQCNSSNFKGRLTIYPRNPKHIRALTSAAPRRGRRQRPGTV